MLAQIYIPTRDPDGGINGYAHWPFMPELERLDLFDAIAKIRVQYYYVCLYLYTPCVVKPVNLSGS